MVSSMCVVFLNSFVRFLQIKLRFLFLNITSKKELKGAIFGNVVTLLKSYLIFGQDMRIKATKVFAKWKKRMTICILDRRMSKEPDPVVRYWIATAIGVIGGRYAKSIA